MVSIEAFIAGGVVLALAVVLMHGGVAEWAVKTTSNFHAQTMKKK